MRPPFVLLASYVFIWSSNAQVADAGPDTLICDGAYTMQGSPVPLGGSGLWTSIQGCAVIDDPASPVTMVGLCPGYNTLVWTVDDNGSVTSDTVIIGVSDLPCIPNAGPDQTIIGPPFTAQLMANSCAFPATCAWTVIVGPSIIADPDDPNTMVGGLGEGPNIFRWTCTTGPCMIFDDITVNAFVWTGIGSAIEDTPPIFVLDTQADLLRLNTSGKVDAVVLTDVQGRAIDLRQVGSMLTWSTAHCAAGSYIVRALVDGQPVSLHFVLDR